MTSVMTHSLLQTAVGRADNAAAAAPLVYTHDVFFIANAFEIKLQRTLASS
jgi:hypothetical protein